MRSTTCIIPVRQKAQDKLQE